MPEKKQVKVDVKSDEPDAPTEATERENQAEDAGAAEAAAGGPDLEKQLEEAQKEASENRDRFLRVSAEFENFKKRKQREMDDFRKFANEALIRELLTVVDNLERALESSAENCESERLVEGVELTLKDILKIFDKFMVRPIEALEKEFDPTVHQAVLQEPSETHAENTVIREFQKGYTIHDRLLRPAMVVVSTNETPAEDADASGGRDQTNS